MKLKHLTKKFCTILESIDNRCMFNDGPVTPTLQEATSKELRQLYVITKNISLGKYK